MLFSYSEKIYILSKRNPGCRSFNPMFFMLTPCFLSSSWKGHLSEGYGQLCSIYLKLLRTKMEYHTKVSLCDNPAATASHALPSPPLPPPPRPVPSHLAGLNCQVFQVMRQPGFSGSVHTISQLCKRKHFIEWLQSGPWDVTRGLGFWPRSSAPFVPHFANRKRNPIHQVTL